ncbi:DNA-3-methyladenine glycosylase [Rubrolithibacter danxiaensis]|uniref:DNA-3-methyladenine glycosylase n=1 Tax=Rubrolithibacter danxiaensis TaxID=3390805 RepID=UPI003BF83530
MKLSQEYYQQEDVVFIAEDLLGKQLFTYIDGELTGGTIVETEAYKGPEDRGSHAWNNKRTPRNEMMYAAGGVVYMYICYGIHDMLNIVTGKENTSHAILIRAMQPAVGVELMRQRRALFNNDERLCQGPGALAKALGLSKKQNGCSLSGEEVWIEEVGNKITPDQIIRSPRVGMNFEGPYKSIPWRFYIKRNKFVSKPRIA